jgi:glycosyltransferase involved in cell wall biosynthesis
VFIEALACGRPLIATRCGGPESIVNEGNGLLLPVGDVEALSGALLTMFEKSRSFDPLALRRDFERRYGRAATVAALRRIYDDAMSVAGASEFQRPTGVR